MLEGEDKPLLPAIMEPLDTTSAHITITEGRYHQVRRMFAAIGNHVTALHRDKIGSLDLPKDLEPGNTACSPKPTWPSCCPSPNSLDPDEGQEALPLTQGGGCPWPANRIGKT